MKNGKSILKKWWFWVIVIVVIAGVFRRGGLQTTETSPSTRQTAPAAQGASSAPAASESAAAAPAETPAKSEAKETKTLKETDIRPEVKEYLDAYEACINEYVDFMKKYEKADSGSALSMMGDYYRILTRYTEFAEKIDAFDESELTNAELAYYLGVTNRVSQKLLRVAG